MSSISHRSDPWDQLLPLASVTTPAKGLQVGLFGLPALTDRDDVIDFKVDGCSARSTSSSVAQQHRCPNGIGNPSLRKAVLVSALLRLSEGNEVPKGAHVNGIRGSDELLQL
jgi:hypothetical protein